MIADVWRVDDVDPPEVAQRLSAKDIKIEANWVGHYCTSLDMAGASITVLHLDNELTELLHHPCDTAVLRVG